MKQLKFATQQDCMKATKAIFYFFLIVSVFSVYIITNSGCAQIGSPTGGPKDTLAPVLVSANPPLKNTNFTGNKITLNFNEYVNLDNIQNNLLIAPYPKTTPEINFKLRTVTIKLKDTLLENTTYTINFGNAIKDVNEGNILKDFSYIFSTGNTIDSLELKGNVIVAETGKVDSTLLVLLYHNANDSSVKKRKPDYIARLSNQGAFTFHNLPSGTFSVYALKDEDGSKTYNSPFEEIAFADSDIIISPSVKPVTLYAFAEQKEAKKQSSSSNNKSGKQKQNIKFRYIASVSQSSSQDVLSDLEVDFTKPVKNLDTQKILLTDTLFHPLNTVLTLDSTRKKVIIKNKWQLGQDYYLIVNKDAASDSADEQFSKTDTIRFKTKAEADYGSLLIRFSNIDTSLHPVLQLIQADTVYRSIPITSAQWSDKLFTPGEYELRILYDANMNGKWDAGNYSTKLQPEKVVSLDKHLVIRPNWDNERDIKL